MNPQGMNVLALQDALRTGDLTSEALVLHFLDRIARIDHGDPAYNSVYMVNPDALAIARACDREREEGSVRGVMHGIPVLLKDNINTGDRQTTTAGANILKHHFAKDDAALVQTLRAQGAIVLGKTNLTELACFKSFRTVNGFSSLAGYVLCPWDTDADPSGSSTGSAVAVSLGLAPVAIGTETGGSIMSPAMRNGVVGLKPTIGLVSRRGIVPISPTLDTAGPMGRTVTDVAALLTAMVTKDNQDPITLSQPQQRTDYTDALFTSLKGRRIGLDNSGYDELSPKRKAAYDQVVSILTDQGCEIIENLDIQQTKRIYHVMKYEFHTSLNHYLAKEGLGLTLRDIVRYNEQDAKANLKYGQEVLMDALHHASGGMTDPDYILALTERDEAKRALEATFETNQLDLIYFASYTSLGPHCGFPTLSLPIDLDEDGMPIGTYFLAPYWREDTLIAIASNIERALARTFDPLQSHQKSTG